MKILILPVIFPSEQRPGEGIFILRCAQALRDRGHEVAVLRVVPLAPPMGNKWRKYASIPSKYEVEGIPVRAVRAIIPPRRIGLEFVPWQVHRAVEDEIRRFRPDVLHANFLIESGQIAVRHGVPSVVTAHGSDAYNWPYTRPGLMRAAREAIMNATRVTAVSEFIRKCVQSIAPREVDVIWNGGDERFFFPRDRAIARAEMGLPADRFIITFAGNLLRAKGLYELLEAAAALKQLSPLVLVAGEGPEEAALRQRAQRDGVELRLLGRLDQDRVSALFGAGDVVTLPSYNEGLPNVVCEAMLCGRAVVASAVGGIPEVIEHGLSGLLVSAGNVEQLREALRSCAGASPARESMESAARDFAARNLTWRVSAARYEDVFAQAIESRSVKRFARTSS